MKQFYLLEYFNEKNSNRKIFLDKIKYELDKHIYYYGKQFKHPREITKTNIHLSFLKNKIRKIIKSFLFGFHRSSSIKINNKTIITNTYFSLEKEIVKLGYQIMPAPWSDFAYFLKEKKLINDINYLDKIIKNGTFSNLLDEDFEKKVESFEENFEKFCLNKNVEALFISSDQLFYEKSAISVFKKLKKPTFIFLHGLPGRYNHIDENRSDYLIVWGEKIKQNYIKAGINKNKIFVAGHPKYQNFDHNKKNYIWFR